MVAAWGPARGGQKERRWPVFVFPKLKHPLAGSAMLRLRKRGLRCKPVDCRFLFADCDLAMTFLDVADTTAITETAQRNRQNARKTFSTILRAIPKLVLSAAERQSIEKKLSAVMTRLEGEFPAENSP